MTGPNEPKGTTYRDAGVDIDAGDELVEKIKPYASATMRPEVLAGVGGFSALCALPSKYKEPILVASTDGVGTKLKLAFATGKHDTIGLDLVGMVVNDLVTCGAEPLFLLDYFATGKLSVAQGEQVIQGIAEGCRQAGCALVGGETAEMPGFYPAGEYDLAGFGVGVVEKKKIIDGTRAKAGDALVGVASAGLHSNGFSLVRKVLFPAGDPKVILQQKVEALGNVRLADALLAPTRIYAKLALALAAELDVKGLAHVTGGGLPGNLPRVFPDTLSARVDSKSWTVPPIFDVVRESGSVPMDEMFRTFNMGIGLVAIVPPKEAARAIEIAKAHGDAAWKIGELVPRTGADCEIV